MAVTRTEVTELYIAFFERAPDAAGLDYWVNDSGLSIDEISQSFFDQAETQAKYPDTMTDSEFVTEIYNNVFDHGADPDGLTYWVNELEAGTISRADMIMAVVNGALGTDQDILDNKTEVGLAFADAGLSDYDDSVSIMNGVTADDQTVEDALIQIDDWATEASTEDFTTERDTLPGTPGDDIFSGDANNNAATDTYQAFDAADGAEGEDSVLITASAAANFTAGAATLTNIETLHVTQNGVGNIRVDATNFDANINKLVADGSSTAAGNIVFGNGGASNLHAVADIDLSTKNGVATAQVVTVNYDAVAIAAGNDASELTLTNNVAQTLNSFGVEDYTIHTGTGAQALTLTDGALNTVTIDGAGDLTLTLAPGSAARSIDASAATGDITSLTGNVVNFGNPTVTGGEGNDTLEGNAAADTIVGGAGNDTLNGLKGFDTLTGEAGNDTMDGGVGQDLMTGGAGADILIGGSGSDTYNYTSDTDSSLASMDTILGFFVGGVKDVINVSEAIRTSGGTATDLALAAANFDAQAGGLAEGASYIGAGVVGESHAYQDTLTGNVYIDVNQDNIYNAADDLVVGVQNQAGTAGVIIAAVDIIV